jgi:hypothetical protein
VSCARVKVGAQAKATRASRAKIRDRIFMGYK